jgi:hypothetical protein
VTAVVVAFDPLDSNWPFQRGFVTFLANAVEWLGGLDQAAVQEEHRPGETLSVRVTASVRESTVTAPDGTKAVIPSREGTVTYGPVTRAGTYRFTWADDRGEQLRAFAVNPAAGEGHIAALPEIEVGTERVAASGGAGTLSDLWPYALAAALLLLVVEWWAYHRRHWVRPAAGARVVRPIGAGESRVGGAPIIRA